MEKRGEEITQIGHNLRNQTQNHQAATAEQRLAGLAVPASLPPPAPHPAGWSPPGTAAEPDFPAGWPGF